MTKKFEQMTIDDLLDGEYATVDVSNYKVTVGDPYGKIDRSTDATSTELDDLVLRIPQHTTQSKLNVGIKRLHPDANIPQYAHSTDAGFDLVAVEDTIIEPGETAIVKTGIALDIPEGFEVQIRPRSGITVKTKLRVQLGTVDAGYNGEIGVIVDNDASVECRQSTINGMPEPYLESSSETIDGSNFPTETRHIQPTYLIRKGDRIAQAVLSPIIQAHFSEVTEFGESERGEGGFGSSGTNTKEESE